MQLSESTYAVRLIAQDLGNAAHRTSRRLSLGQVVAALVAAGVAERRHAALRARSGDKPRDYSKRDETDQLGGGQPYRPNAWRAVSLAQR